MHGEDEDHAGLQPLTATVLVCGDFPAPQNSFQLRFTAVCFKGLQASGTSGFVQCFLQQETGMKKITPRIYLMPWQTSHVYNSRNFLSCRKATAILDQCEKLFHQHKSEQLGLGSPVPPLRGCPD